MNICLHKDWVINEIYPPIVQKFPASQMTSWPLVSSKELQLQYNYMSYAMQPLLLGGPHIMPNMNISWKLSHNTNFCRRHILMQFIGKHFMGS